SLSFNFVPPSYSSSHVSGNLLKPPSANGPPVHQLPDIAERNRLPFAVDDCCFLGRVVPAALLLSDLFGDVADVEQFLVEKEREKEANPCNVGARTSFRRRRDAGLPATNAGQFVVDFDACLLLIGRRQCLLHIFVKSLNKRAFMQKGERLGRGARGPPAHGTHGPEAREPQKSTA